MVLTQFNLSWKLALVEKGLAEPFLLDTYSEERVSVIAEMLKKSTDLFNGSARSEAAGANTQSSWRRGGELHQFGVHCRWSSIVLDERTPKEDGPVDPYGRNHSPADVVRAGERAPDAPGLAVLGAAEMTTLFKLFGVSHHTVLIFSDGTDRDGAVLSALKAYPADSVRTVLIREGTNGSHSESEKADVDVIDEDWQAHEGYQVQKGEFLVVVVRPDGVVGAIVCGSNGTRKYFAQLFKALVMT